MSTAVRSSGMVATLRDVVALTKPSITLMVVITAAGGMWLARHVPDAPNLPWQAMILVLLTTAAVVASANSLNCWLERDSDRLMERTANRPLPDGRLDPAIAYSFGIVTGLVSVPLLSFAVNPMTGLLGAVALVSYVAVYTPMKRVSPTSLLVGAIPGALPPLMGWTAVTGRLDLPGIVLFLIMFLWQVPHFIAISIFRQADYERAGLKVLPSVKGLAYSKFQAALYAAILAPISLAPYMLGVAGGFYLVTAIVLNAAFVGVALYGLRADAGIAWSRKLFFTSLIYLTVLFPVLMIDARG